MKCLAEGISKEKKAVIRRFSSWVWIYFVILAACVGYVWYQYEKGWTPHKVERALKQGIPFGSTRNQVEDWLAKMAWNQTGNFAVMTGDVDAQLAGLDLKELSGAIGAAVPDSNVDLIWPGYIAVYFYFDRNGRLVKYLVKPFVFSL